MQQKVWIFGDSYANDTYDKSYAWTKRIAKDYNTTNYAVGGTGPEYMINVFRNAVIETDIEELKDINLIFFISNDDRKNFSFTVRPEDQAVMINSVFNEKPDDFIRKRTALYKNQKKFIHNFYKKYYIHNDLKDFRNLAYIGILKEYSKFFKKVLVVSVFDNIEKSLLHTKFGCTIEDTENFTYCRGPDLYSIEKDINKPLPNHLSIDNHTLLHEQIKNWIDINIPPDLNNLKKIA